MIDPIIKKNCLIRDSDQIFAIRAHPCFMNVLRFFAGTVCLPCILIAVRESKVFEIIAPSLSGPLPRHKRKGIVTRSRTVYCTLWSQTNLLG